MGRNGPPPRNPLTGKLYLPPAPPLPKCAPHGPLADAQTPQSDEPERGGIVSSLIKWGVIASLFSSGDCQE
jgi:hypothetical protein